MQELERIVDYLPEAILVANRQGVVVHVNGAAARMYDLEGTAEALRPLSEYGQLLQLAHPDGRAIEPSERPLARALAGEQFESYRLFARTKRGRELLIESSGAPLRNELGEVVYGIIADRDVTALRRQERRFEILAETAQAVAKERRLDPVLMAVLDAVTGLFGAERTVSIFRVDRQREQLVLLADRNLTPETVARFRRLPLSAPVAAAQAARTGIICAIEDTSKVGDDLAMARELAALEGLRSLISLPLSVAGDEVIGVLTVGTHTEEQLLSIDVDTLAALGNLFAVSLQNAMLNEMVEASRSEATASLLAMQQLVGTATGTKGLGPSLDVMIRQMVETTAADCGMILLLDAPSGLLTAQATYGVSLELWNGFFVRLGEGFEGRIALQRRPLVIADATKDPLLVNPALKSLGIKSMLGVPLLQNDHVIGVAHVGTKERRDFGEAEVRRAQAMAEVVALTIEKTERYEVAERNAARLAAILESVPDAILIVDHVGQVVDANPAALRLFRITARGEALCPFEEYRRLFETRDVEGLQNACHQFTDSFQGQSKLGQELRVTMKDGEQLILQYNLAPVRDRLGKVGAVILVARDVTAARRAERESEIISRVGQALSRKLELEAMIDTVLDQCTTSLGAEFASLFLADEDRGELVMERQRGLREATVALLERMPFDAPFITAKAYVDGKPIAVEEVAFPSETAPLSRIVADLESIQSIASIPLRAAGRNIGALMYGTREPRRFPPEEIAAMTVVADMFGMAVENARLFQDSQERAALLEDERRQREQFISVVAHELRGPLSIMMGYSRFLEQDAGVTGEARRRAMGAIREQTHKLNRLVADLLDASRITAGRFEIRREPSELLGIVRSVVEQQQMSTERHRIVLETPGEEATLNGHFDPDRVAQALGNLVGNAIKYSPSGGDVLVKLEVGDGKVKLSVSDQGIGMSAEQLALLFRPYARLARNRDLPGVGLGLYITKGIVEAHGGHIWAKSQEGLGTTFSFTLPLGEVGSRK